MVFCIEWKLLFGCGLLPPSLSFQWLYLCGVYVGKVEYENYENYRYTLGIKFKEQILLTILENKMFLYRY